MNRSRGFTLVEILIAMLILSAVMYIGSMSFSVFSQKWQQGQARFDTAAERARALLLLRQALQGSANYLVRNDKQQPEYLFEGTAKSLLFVTSQGLFSPGQLSLVRLQVESPADSTAADKLWYQETPLSQAPLLSLEQLPPASAQTLLLSAANIRFNYFGWASVTDIQRFLDGEGTKPQWQEFYQAGGIGRLPFTLNISWADDEPVLFSLPQDEGYLLLFSNEKFNGE